MPQSEKSRVFRVTMLNSLSLAIAAICPSRMLIGLHHFKDNIGIEKKHIKCPWGREVLVAVWVLGQSRF